MSEPENSSNADTPAFAPSTPPPAVSPLTAGHVHVTTQVAGWLTEALREHAMGERIRWDIAFQIVANPQGPTPVFVLYFEMPSPLVGQLLVEMVVIEPRAVVEDNVRTQVREAVERLVRARAHAVSPLN